LDGPCVVRKPQSLDCLRQFVQGCRAGGIFGEQLFDQKGPFLIKDDCVVAGIRIDGRSGSPAVLWQMHSPLADLVFDAALDVI
jgi:hypothetical protein